jgi:hypothetical protein
MFFFSYHAPPYSPTCNVRPFSSNNVEYNATLIGSSSVLPPQFTIMPSSKPFMRHFFLDAGALISLVQMFNFPNMQRDDLFSLDSYSWESKIDHGMSIEGVIHILMDIFFSIDI